MKAQNKGRTKGKKGAVSGSYVLGEAGRKRRLKEIRYLSFFAKLPITSAEGSRENYARGESECGRWLPWQEGR